MTVLSVHDRPERCNDKESDSQKALSIIVDLLEVNTGGTLKRRTAASVRGRPNSTNAALS